jgi:hypothetical protein
LGELTLQNSKDLDFVQQIKIIIPEFEQVIGKNLKLRIEQMLYFGNQI